MKNPLSSKYTDNNLYLAYIFHTKNKFFTQNVYASDENKAKEKIISYYKIYKPDMNIVDITFKETIT